MIILHIKVTRGSHLGKGNISEFNKGTPAGWGGGGRKGFNTNNQSFSKLFKLNLIAPSQIQSEPFLGPKPLAYNFYFYFDVVLTRTAYCRKNGIGLGMDMLLQGGDLWGTRIG